MAPIKGLKINRFSLCIQRPGEKCGLSTCRAQARGFEWSREAAAAFSRGRKPMEYGTPPPSRVGGDSNHSWWLISGKSGPRPAVRIIRGKTADRKTNHEWTRINTNRPEDGWTSFNGKRRQNASALLSRWCDHVMGGSPPGSAGVPPAQILFSESRPVPFGETPVCLRAGRPPPATGQIHREGL